MDLNVKKLLARTYTRRSVIGGGAITAAAAALPFKANAFDTTDIIEFAVKPLPIRDLPREFVGYRVGFMADNHLGVNVPIEWTEQALDFFTAHPIDLLILGGDYVAMNDNPLAKLLERKRNKTIAARPFREHPLLAYSMFGDAVKRAVPKVKDGAVAIYGNHDRWVAPDLCSQALSSAGVQILVNETHRIHRGDAELMIYGTDDYWNGIPSLKNLEARRPGVREMRLLLTHNPDFAALMFKKDASAFDLILCGHTHGGQIKAPLIGALFYNVENIEFTEGLFTSPEGTLCYTTRGLGVVEIPYRINCPAEAVIFELTQA